MADETPKPEELIQIDHRPPKTDWMDVPVNIRKGMYCYASNPKSVEYLGTTQCQGVESPGRRLEAAGKLAGDPA